MILFKGAATALITPFTKDSKSIDYSVLEKQINWQISNHIDALVIAGTTGEAATLSNEEYHQLLTATAQIVNNRVPLIAGTGSNSTQHTIENTLFAESIGIEGALIVNPYYNKSTQKGLVAHFTAIHDATNIPIIIYNVPSRTGMNITAETVLTLSRLPRIIGVKEASNQFSQITEIARLMPSDFALYSGNDDTIVPLLALGGHGVISVASNIIPNEIHQIVTSFLQGNYNKSKDLQFFYKPLIDALFIETSPTPIKMAMHLLGLEPGPLRLPLVEVEEKTKTRLQEELLKAKISRGWN